MEQHLFIIGYVWPEPTSSAAGSRMIQLIKLFKEAGWAITFGCPAQETHFMADLNSFGVSTAKININDPSFDRFFKQLKPTAVLFDRFMIEEQFGWRISEHSPDTLRILDTEDLHCLRYGRQQALKSKIDFTVGQLKELDITKREIGSILRCDLSLLTSKVEANILTRHLNVPSEILYHLPFLLEPLSLDKKDTWPHFIQREHFVTIGNLRHAPNWDCVLYLKETIWPLIRQKLPKAQMHVYGAYTPPKAKQLHNPKEGFLIKDRAPNAFTVLKQARVCLAPLRFGAGIKGKFTDAMQCGTPNVTTTIGAESMHEALPWGGIIANSPETIANAAITLYTDQKKWNIAQENGITLINELYDGHILGEQFLGHLNQVITTIKLHRSKNFMGNLLNFHMMKSTKYMSLWISEKNASKINSTIADK